MFINKFFRLHNDTPGESGSTPTVDRGDLLIPEDTDLDPENPDAKLDAPEVDPKAYASLLERLGARGFDVRQLERTAQQGLTPKPVRP